MTDLKPYYQVKITPDNLQSIFSSNPPKTEDEKYAYDIIQKAYWINEKNIEMLDCKVNEKLLKECYTYLAQKSK